MFFEQNVADNQPRIDKVVADTRTSLLAILKMSAHLYSNIYYQNETIFLTWLRRVATCPLGRRICTEFDVCVGNNNSDSIDQTVVSFMLLAWTTMLIFLIGWPSNLYGLLLSSLISSEKPNSLSPNIPVVR